MITIYGIKNCETMKKSFAWCAEHGINYVFHDYKAAGIEPGRLNQWCRHLGWKTLLNTRGTTWRKLPADKQAVATQAQAVALMSEYPTLIKRPVVETDGQLLVGFDPRIFSSFVR